VSIAALKAAGFKGAIDLPGSAAYANATDAWALNYKQNAQVALEPTSTSDVQIAVRMPYVLHDVQVLTRRGRIDQMGQPVLFGFRYSLRWSFHVPV
jgi:hypothetical protein